jgi:hypothetical protein
MNPRYYQGTPCKNGHEGRRYESTGGCVDCALAAAKKRYIAKKPEILPPGKSA